MSNNFFGKDPDAVLDYTHNWLAWLDGDTISTSIWIVDDGIVKDSDLKTTTTATIWLSGGTLGKAYKIVNRITTVGLRTDDRTSIIHMEDK